MRWTLPALSLLLLLAPSCGVSNLVQSNKRLENSVLRTLPESSVYHCYSVCVEDLLCLSFNFYAPTLECQLNFNSSTQRPQDLVTKKRSYFANKDTLKSTQATSCSAASCSQSELCRVQRGTSQPTCISRDTLPPTYVAHNCHDVMSIMKTNGIYNLTADEVHLLPVYCDMTTDGGGWLVFQRRMDGSVDFYRTWDEYMRGFGQLSGEFWLGNENIRKLTKHQRYELRVNMEDFKGNKFYAIYSNFSLDSKENKYALHIGNYSGNADDFLGYHNGLPFSAKDADYDQRSMNCAEKFVGAWWYRYCYNSNLNGLYNETLHWGSLRLKRTEMKIRPVI